MPCSITAAASVRSMPSGTATARSAATSASSAYAPRASTVATWSPAANALTPGPTAVTTPAPARPGVELRRGGHGAVDRGGGEDVGPAVGVDADGFPGGHGRLA